MKFKSVLLTVMLISVAFMFTACNSPEFTSAKMYVQQKDLVKAEEFFLKALDTEPTNPEVPYLLAKDVYGPNKDYINVEKYLNESLKRGDTYKQEIKDLKEFYWGKAFNEGVKYYNQLVKKEYDNKETAIHNAVEKFREAQLFKKKDPKAYLQEAVIVFSFLEDKVMAVLVLDNALEEIPGNIEILSKKALFLNDMGKEDEAIALFQNIMNEQPDNLKIGQSFAGLLFKQEKFEQAIEVYNKLIAEHPDKKNLYFNLALSYVRIDKLEDAKIQFETVLAFDPNDKETLLAVGDTYQNLDNYITSEIYYRKLLELEPTNPKYLMRIAKSLNGQKKYEEGMKYFKQSKALQ